MANKYEMRLPALEVRQGKRRLYQFAIDGKKLHDVATVSRIHRDDGGEIGGYQRPESIAHIRAIRMYLEHDDALMPNALVIAFDSRARFEAIPGDRQTGARVGHLVIPVDPSCADEDKPGWIVDGQQRAAAIRDANIKSFPVPIVAFITDDVAQQRAQFILVNSTKPLPKGLIHELLPSTDDGDLPLALLRKRYPATLLEALNYRDGSPLNGLIRTTTVVTGVIKDNSMLKMLENSITDGALYRFRDPDTGTGDMEKMLGVLFNFWAAVSDTFPHAWGQPPRRSRLMHGAGIMSLGFVMDAITDRRSNGDEVPTRETYRLDLERLVPVCAWTSGYWDFGPRDQRPWNELQNTPRDIQLLADYLLAEYWSRTFDGEERHLRVVAS
jgi:DGQHR domain-containing protein